MVVVISIVAHLLSVPTLEKLSVELFGNLSATKLFLIWMDLMPQV
jgi:hypothetical protein